MLHTGGGPTPSDTSRTTIISVLRTSLAADDLPPESLARALSGSEFESVRLGRDGLPMDEDEDALLGKVIVTTVSALLLMFAVMVGGSTFV